MRVSFGLLAATACCALLLSACGGGGSGGDSLTVSPRSVQVTADTKQAAPTRDVTATLGETPDRDIYAFIEHSNLGIEDASFHVISDRSGVVSLRFRSPDTLGPGEFRDTLTLRVCYDPQCASQASGSPKTIPVTYTVTGEPAPAPEPALAPTSQPVDNGPLPIRSSRLLTHDVVDAEYSKALDAVVMVSSAPPALHLYDVTTQAERVVALATVPTAVSVSPDGLSADVGHGDSVSHVDLTRVGSGSPDTVRRFSLERPVGDLVTADSGWTHVFSAGNQSGGIYSINVLTGSTRQFGGFEDMRARLNPLGSAIYGTTTTISPSDIYRYSLDQGTISGGRDSPYHGNYQMCGDLWLSANGRRVYTACGNTFRASDFPSQDMTYMGILPRLNNDFYGPRIVSLSDSAEAGQIALIDAPAPQFQRDCGVVYAECSSRLGIYESQHVNAIATYSIPDAQVDGVQRRQVAQYVFHSRDGTTKYLITWLYPGSTYQVLTVQ